MGGFIKKQTSTFYLNFANLILALCGMIFCILSSSGAYRITKIGIVVSCVVFSMVLNVIMLLLDKKIRTKVSYDILRWLVVILICIALSLMISERTVLMGYIYFSDLESGNPVAVAAMNNAVVSWILYGLALITSVIGGFRKVKSE
jgi:hypothetical protein